MLELLSSPETYVSLLTLSVMEIVLGIDNLIFISVLTSPLPGPERERARRVGLMGALVLRVGFLFALSWLMRLTEPLFSVWGHPFSGQSLILLSGGLFLVYKSTREIHDKLEGEEHSGDSKVRSRFWPIVAQIIVLDIVFSIDSVVTAIGMSTEVAIMIAANVIALAIMLWAGGFVGRFVERHPTVKMLALSFLLLIGVLLCAEGLGFHIPKGYVYFAMGFSALVELLNLRARKGRPVTLRNTPHAPPEQSNDASPGSAGA
jgi:predicted tellurium resistance membrane protein TerC